jgi:acetyl-CoA acetyltransferase
MNTLKKLNAASKKEIFRDLVNLQDETKDVARSREMIMERHGVTREQLKRIEEEGIEGEWPPLDE